MKFLIVLLVMFTIAYCGLAIKSSISHFSSKTASNKIQISAIIGPKLLAHANPVMFNIVRDVLDQIKIGRIS